MKGSKGDHFVTLARLSDNNDQKPATTLAGLIAQTNLEARWAQTAAQQMAVGPEAVAVAAESWQRRPLEAGAVIYLRRRSAEIVASEQDRARREYQQPITDRYTNMIGIQLFNMISSEGGAYAGLCVLWRRKDAIIIPSDLSHCASAGWIEVGIPTCLF